MKQLRLDPNTWDIVVSNYTIEMIEGLDYLAQKIKQNLLTFYEECRFNRDLGVDYFGQVLVKNPDYSAIHAMILRELQNTEGVVSVESLTVGPSKTVEHFLAIEFVVKGTEGTLTDTVTL